MLSAFTSLQPSNLDRPQSHWTHASATASMTPGRRHLHKVNPLSSLFSVIIGDGFCGRLQWMGLWYYHPPHLVEVLLHDTTLSIIGLIAKYYPWGRSGCSFMLIDIWQLSHLWRQADRFKCIWYIGSVSQTWPDTIHLSIGWCDGGYRMTPSCTMSSLRKK